MEPSGYLHYDPYSAGTQYKKPPFNCGLLQFLNIIYDHCWQRHKPTEEQYGETPFGNDFFQQPSDPNKPFFCMFVSTPHNLLYPLSRSAPKNKGGAEILS